MTSEERALHGVVYQLESSWNAADAAGFAAPFADDAEFIHILGGYYTGRAAIEAGHRMILGTIYKSSTVRFSVEKIKFIRPDVALVFLRQFLQLLQDGTPHEVQARPMIVAESVEGKWHIAAMQNTRISDVGSNR